MVSFSAIHDYVAGLVHPSAAQDEGVAERHRAFIASHLAGGLIAFAALPLLVVARGAPSTAELIAFALLVAPIVAALELSRSGRLDRAHLISAAGLAGLVAVIGAVTGGVESSALVWLAVIPMEAAFSGSRRIIAMALLMALAVVAGLAGLGASGLLPTPLSALSGAQFALFGVVSAVAYAGALSSRLHTMQLRIAAVREEEDERYRLLADNMSDLITRHTRSGGVLFASPAAQRILGVPPRELSGQRLFERVHVADRPAYVTAFANACLRGAAESVEFRLRRDAPGQAGQLAPADYVWVEMRCRPVPAPNDEASVQIVAVTREIEERKRHEEELTAAREEADRANAAKSRFLASISHELRTPLNAIIGFSELLSNTELACLTEAQRQEYATLIHESGLHLLAVVNSILDMSKIESGNFHIIPEPFDMAPMISGCVQLFALKATAAHVTVETNVQSTLPEVVADPRACKQIIINLLSNAIKFTPAGGRVVIGVRRQMDDVLLEVADTGVGIAAEDLPYLSDPFYQAKSSYDRPYEGTGLGLSVVKGLVDLHHGRMTIDSALGAGTRVTVRLPLAPPVQAGRSEAVYALPGSAVGETSQNRVKLRA